MSSSGSPAPVPPLGRGQIELVGSFPDPDHPLEPPLPEFALIGRSNVGKSSLLNALVGRRALARVSSTPGKTQLLNIYRLPQLYLIDLPGYGFARAGRSERAAYRQLLEQVITQRSTLSGVVWLLDVRHTPSSDDAEFQQMLAATSHGVLVVLTKADKLSRAQLQRAVQDRINELGLPAEQVQAVSAHSGMGIVELGASLLHAAEQEGG